MLQLLAFSSALGPSPCGVMLLFSIATHNHPLGVMTTQPYRRIKRQEKPAYGGIGCWRFLLGAGAPFLCS